METVEIDYCVANVHKYIEGQKIGQLAVVPNYLFCGFDFGTGMVGQWKPTIGFAIVHIVSNCVVSDTIQGRFEDVSKVVEALQKFDFDSYYAQCQQGYIDKAFVKSVKYTIAEASAGEGAW